MLYLTTREKYDAFTVARTLSSNVGSDGGLYVPYKMPRFSADDTAALKDLTFGQTIAEMLNRFFNCGLTAWDVDLCIGKCPLRVNGMGQKIFVAEFWRNLEGSYEKMERLLCNRISGVDRDVTSWLRIAIRIAFLTASFGELHRQGITDPVDIAVPDGDFTAAMAIWYARMMGLPVADIICACKEGSPAWELLVKGRVRSLSAMPELERLIFGTLGVSEVLRCRDLCANGSAWELNPLMLEQLCAGIRPAIVSDDRTDAAIPNVFNTYSYILEPATAKAYSGLLDHRAHRRNTGAALLLADHSPCAYAETICAALCVDKEKLKELLR